MPVDQKIREALRLRELKLPRNPKVVDIRVEDYVDTDGEDALRVLVVLDEEVTSKSHGTRVSDLKTAIRDRIRELGVELWPYIFLAKQSELDEDDEERGMSRAQGSPGASRQAGEARRQEAEAGQSTSRDFVGLLCHVSSPGRRGLSRPDRGAAQPGAVSPGPGASLRSTAS